MPDPVRVLLDKAPELEKCTEEVEAKIDELYEAVSTLKDLWRTIIVNGETPGVQEELAINVDRLPTWATIRELLAQWRALDVDYRMTWEQLSDDEQERLPNLSPSTVEDSGRT